MLKKIEAYPRLSEFRQRVASRERELGLEITAQYPREQASVNYVRAKARKGAPAAPIIVWPSPGVMPGEKELHDFVNQRLAKRFEDLLPPTRIRGNPKVDG